jgi:hypothetical protein
MFAYADTDINKLIKMLQEESKILIYWFSINKMKANPEKVQAITVGKKTHDKNNNFLKDLMMMGQRHRILILTEGGRRVGSRTH